MVRRSFLATLFAILLAAPPSAQVVIVERNVNLRADPFSRHELLRKLQPPEIVALLDAARVSGYLRVRI